MCDDELLDGDPSNDAGRGCYNRRPVTREGRTWPACYRWARADASAPNREPKNASGYQDGPSWLGICPEPVPIPCPSPLPSPTSACPPVSFIGAGLHSAQDAFHQTSVKTLPNGRVVPWPIVGGKLFRLDSTARHGACGTRGGACDGERPDNVCGGRICDDPRGPRWEVLESPSECVAENPGDDGRGYMLRCGPVNAGVHRFRVCVPQDWKLEDGTPVGVCRDVCSEVIEVIPE